MTTDTNTTVAKTAQATKTANAPTSNKGIPFAIMSLAQALDAVNKGMALKRQAVRAMSDALHAGVRQALYNKQLDLLTAVICGGTYDVGGKMVECAGLHKDKDAGRIIKALYVLTGGSEGNEDQRVYNPELSILRYDAQANALTWALNPKGKGATKAFNRIQVGYASMASATYEDVQPKEAEKPYTYEQVIRFIRRLQSQEKNWADKDRAKLREVSNLLNGYDVRPGEDTVAADMPGISARLDGKPKLKSTPR